MKHGSFLWISAGFALGVSATLLLGWVGQSVQVLSLKPCRIHDSDAFEHADEAGPLELPCGQLIDVILLEPGDSERLGLRPDAVSISWPPLEYDAASTLRQQDPALSGPVFFLRDSVGIVHLERVDALDLAALVELRSD